MVLKNKKRKIVKETTIDDLAIMIGKGFAHVDKRFEETNKRIDILTKDNAREHKEMIKNNAREHKEMKVSIERLRADNAREHKEMMKKNNLEHKKIIEMIKNDRREYNEARANNTLEHKEIRLKLSEAVYRFELNELQKRVEILERTASSKIS